MTISEVRSRLHDQCALFEALNFLKRDVLRPHLEADVKTRLVHCQQNAPEYVGKVHAIGESLFAFCQNRVRWEEAKDEHARILRAILLLKQKWDTVVKILGYVYPLRALCNA